MGFMAPKERQHLSAEALFGLLRNHLANLLDHRSDDAGIALTEALRSGCAMFARKCPALLDDDKQRAAATLQTISGMARAPGASSMRERLDPCSPEALRPSFQAVFRPLQRGKALAEMVFFQGGYGLARDGTGDFSSQTIHGQSCLAKPPRDGSVPSLPPRLGAARMHPDRRAVMALMPEPIVQHEGSEKNDGERHAAKRFMAKVRQAHPPLGFLVTAEGIRAHAPHLETLHDDGCHSILGGKAGDQASLCAQVQVAEREGRLPSSQRHDRATGIAHPLRLVHDMPRNASRADVRVPFMESWEVREDKVQHWSWGTDFRVPQHHVDTLLRGGRARWKMAKETCKTLQNQGDNVDHNAGHGEQHLSVVCATLRMLAFLVDHTPPLCGAWLQAVWHQRGRKRLLGERIRALVVAAALESMRQLLEALLDGLQTSAPALAVDPSSSPVLFPTYPWKAPEHRRSRQAWCVQRTTPTTFCLPIEPVLRMIYTRFGLDGDLNRPKRVL